MKMPVSNEIEAAISFRFMLNPTRIDNLDDLYDVFEANKGTNVKYFVMYNSNDHKKPADMNLQ